MPHLHPEGPVWWGPGPPRLEARCPCRPPSLLQERSLNTTPLKLDYVHTQRDRCSSQSAAHTCSFHGPFNGHRAQPGGRDRGQAAPERPHRGPGRAHDEHLLEAQVQSGIRANYWHISAPRTYVERCARGVTFGEVPGNLQQGDRL